VAGGGTDDEDRGGRPMARVYSEGNVLGARESGTHVAQLRSGRLPQPTVALRVEL